MFECYEEIIGLSDTDCDCTAADRPANYNASKSGLFLDELANVASLVALAECDKTVWGLMQKAVDNGVKQFVADSNALLGKKYRLKRKSVVNQVLGQIKHRDIYQPTKNYAVVTLSCSPVRGGFIKIRNIGGVFSGTGVVSVELRDNVNGLIDTFTLNTTPDVYTTMVVNQSFPTYSKYMQPLEYYLVYAFDANNLPKDTEINCGCGGWTPSFNRNNPYYNNVGGHKSAPWADYVMVGGREVNSLTELDDDITVMSNNMYGISVEVDFGCKVDEVLCEDALDFVGNPLALSMALAVQYAAGVKLANSILRSNVLTRENMVGSDEWEEAIIEWQEKYNEHVNYIVSEADYTANDCLTCKEIIGLTRKGLFS